MSYITRKNSVSSDKLSLSAQTTSNSSGQTTTTGSFVDMTNQSKTVTTSGGPVIIILQPAGIANPGSIQGSVGSGTIGTGIIQLLRDASAIAQWEIQISANSSGSWGAVVPASLIYVDTGASAGSHTYKFQLKSGSSSQVAAVQDVMMVIIDL